MRRKKEAEEDGEPARKSVASRAWTHGEQRAKEKRGRRQSDGYRGLERTCRSGGIREEDTGGGTAGQESSRREKGDCGRMGFSSSHTNENSLDNKRNVCKTDK